MLSVYKILLTAPVTVASTDKFFLKLNIQELFAILHLPRELTLLSITLIENKISKSINFDDLINL